MKRITTDTPQGNCETMLNFAYAEDGWVKIRGINGPFTSYIENQCRRNGCNLSEMSPQELNEAVWECAFSNPECPIFLLYIVSCQAAELRARLSDYEDSGFMPDKLKELQENQKKEEQSNYQEQVQRAVEYFEDAIRESDEIISECSADLQAELQSQKDHFMVALDALRERNQGAQGARMGGGEEGAD